MTKNKQRSKVECQTITQDSCNREVMGGYYCQSRLGYLLWRCSMAKRVFITGGNTTTKDPNSYCATCPEYLERYMIAQKINQIFDTDGEWDFITCYRSCVKRFWEEEQRMRDKAAKKYAYLKKERLNETSNR